MTSFSWGSIMPFIRGLSVNFAASSVAKSAKVRPVAGCSEKTMLSVAGFAAVAVMLVTPTETVSMS